MAINQFMLQLPLLTINSVDKTTNYGADTQNNRDLLKLVSFSRLLNKESTYLETSYLKNKTNFIYLFNAYITVTRKVE